MKHDTFVFVQSWPSVPNVLARIVALKLTSLCKAKHS